jgi:surface antigen
VGLHPGLSRVLLSRLSEADYKNAGIAIKTALAETPEGSAFLYPRERKTGLALFKVHFVQGAGSDCRRYVVTITKDGWATTAFPMEKCGPQFGRRVPVARRQAG